MKTDPYIEKVITSFNIKFNVGVNTDQRGKVHGIYLSGIEDFITQALLTQREEIKERIKSLKKQSIVKVFTTQAERTQYKRDAWNQALVAAKNAVDGENK